MAVGNEFGFIYLVRIGPSATDNWTKNNLITNFSVQDLPKKFASFLCVSIQASENVNFPNAWLGKDGKTHSVAITYYIFQYV